jgi:ABC-type phosphate transport system substrate-binding protein
LRVLTKLVAGAACMASAAAVALLPATGPAMADPIGNNGSAVTPHEFDVVGVGSDTIEFLLDQIMVDYNKAHTTDTASHPHIFSWDATNPTTGAIGDTIKVKAKCAKIARPDGSSAGILALTGNSKTSDGKHFCIDFARSSRGRASTDPPKAKGGVEFVALAKDAVAYATQKTTNAPSNLTTAQLAAIYSCTATTWNQVGGTSTATIKAELPQNGSGTRAFFLSAIGVATPGSCVDSSVQENEGTDAALKDPNAIVPYSIGKYIAEKFHSAKCLNSSCTPVSGKVCKPASGQNKFGCDVHGTMVLHSVNGTPPTVGSGTSTTINPKFTAAFVRTVYDVVRFATATKDHIPSYLEPFFASKTASKKGWICSSSRAHTDLINYGFLPSPLCGIGF